ncbi:MAG: hypothetical protein EBR23_02025 [Planctomycetia bacterium]|nr:hypothetical protein [Planctomycetia bacterium]
MQGRYAYTLSARPGRDFAPGFRPQLSPARMLRLGVFEGKYLNDCVFELPREWFASALRAGKLSPGRPDPSLNAFRVKSRLSLRQWRRNDRIQIARWRAFTRHRAQILASYKRLGARRPRTAAQKRTHRPRQRQALLQWAYRPYV